MVKKYVNLVIKEVINILVIAKKGIIVQIIVLTVKYVLNTVKIV